MDINWPYVYGKPSASGKIRQTAEHFLVDETLSFIPTGEGEHTFLRIRKKNQNTEYVAGLLAKFAKVRQVDIGYAGLKDRQAITTQWFSIRLPGQTKPDWSIFQNENIHILHITQHAKKLKRGALSGNSFRIVIDDWQGDRNTTEKTLHEIKKQGIANYFGEQRFGHHGLNVEKAKSLFNGAKVNRSNRSMLLSAARSYLFNQILAQRVNDKNWNQCLNGEVLMIDKSNSLFKVQHADSDILTRIDEKKLHPTGVLWGRGENQVSEAVFDLEHRVMSIYPDLSQGLEQCGVDKSRRSLRVMVESLEWQFINASQLVVSFDLPAGSYATALLREIIAY
jgi:tRNA pseudouridine13 synthase